MSWGLGDLMKLRPVESRSISAENVYGDKGRGGMAELSERPQPEVERIGQVWEGPNAAARELGRGWKVRPCVMLPPASVTTVMDVEGPGTIRHIWITLAEGFYRDVILRIYWDDQEHPSVETPIGDFFCNSWKQRTNVLSLPINVNPSGAFNCYFPMPFRRRARVTVENRHPAERVPHFFYAINYEQGAVGEDAAYFHARFNRTNPLPYGTDYTILDGVRGRGHYVGTYMAWQQNNGGWWGEGEFKAFLDGDGEFPTICGTGAEDYFGGAWCFGALYSAPFLGYPQGPQDGRSAPGARHGLYRFHVMDPIHFQRDLRITIQALGWRDGGRYLPGQDDMASVAYWYQTLPHAPFPPLGDRNALEIV